MRALLCTFFFCSHLVSLNVGSAFIFNFSPFISLFFLLSLSIFINQIFLITFLQIALLIMASNNLSNPAISQTSFAKGSKDFDIDKENISPDTKQPKAKGKPSACVFVASLRSSKTDDELCRSVTSLFSKFGELVSVKVLRDPLNRPYAFAQYANDDDCKNAITLGHGTELEGRKLRCEAAKVNRTLFVSSSRPLRLEDLQTTVSRFGEIELLLGSTPEGDVVHMVQGATSFSWFVKFSYRDDAIRAFASLAEDSHFHVEWAQNIDDVNTFGCNIDRTSIYIGLLGPNVTEKEITTHFSVHGEIEEVSVINRLSSSFAFVTYTTEEAAASAVERDNHSMFMDKTIHVQYKEISRKQTPKVILSPRSPVALAPPPINLRKKGLRAKYSNGGDFQTAKPEDSQGTHRDYQLKENKVGLVSGARGFRKRGAQGGLYYFIPQLL